MTHNDFMALICSRTSCRAYREEEVSRDDLNYCLEAARLAPSACNRQPWRFIVVQDKTLRSQICNAGLLPGLPMPWLKSAPIIIVLCLHKDMLTHKIAPLLSGIEYPLLDCGIAGEHLVLAAEARGLGTCWIGWFKTKFIKKLLHLPSAFQPVSLISIGHPAAPAEPRSRLPLEEIVLWK